MQPGEYRDGLRALGDFLDGEQAKACSIINDEHTVVLTWHTSRAGMERRRYGAREVAALSQQLRGRGGMGGMLHAVGRRLLPELAPRPLGRGDVLGELGQLLDEQGMYLHVIHESLTGYRVVGTVGIDYRDEVYLTSQVEGMIRGTAHWSTSPRPSSARMLPSRAL